MHEKTEVNKRENSERYERDFVEWGSRSLIDFLKSIGRDTIEAFSKLDVASIIIECCHRRKG